MTLKRILTILRFSDQFTLFHKHEVMGFWGFGVDWAMGSEGAMGAEEDEGAAIYILYFLYIYIL